MEVTVGRLGWRVTVRQFICARCLQQRSKTVADAGKGRAGGGDTARGARCLSSMQQTSRRRIHGTRRVADNNSLASALPSQQPPLADYYADLLAMSIPTATATATTTTTAPEASEAANTPLPTFVQADGDATKEERARKLFGSIRGSGYERRTSLDTPDETWQTVNGVRVPPRPLEPENCCMSGCVNCVWDDYRIDVEHWAKKMREARAKGATATPTTAATSSSSPKIYPSSASMDDDGGGSDTLWTSPSDPSGSDDDAAALFDDIPVGIREFMATEKKIKARKVKQSQGSG